MGAWLDLLARDDGPPLWLDDTAYSGRLLAGGRVPWLEPSGLIGWRLKALALLKPSLAVLDVIALADAVASRRPDQHRAARADVLATEELARHAAGALRGLRASTRQPLALVVSSPRAWPARLNTDLGAESVAPSLDDVDAIAVRMASFLRLFGDIGIDTLLMTEDGGSGLPTADELALYQPVVNVARHYRWDVGLKTPMVPEVSPPFDYLIAPAGAAGVEISDTFWRSGDPAPRVAVGGFRYGRIPDDLPPERVLARLADLRHR
jgi:hypothetical protein